MFHSNILYTYLLIMPLGYISITMISMLYSGTTLETRTSPKTPQKSNKNVWPWQLEKFISCRYCRASYSTINNFHGHIRRCELKQYVLCR